MKLLELINEGKQKKPKAGDLFAYRMRGEYGFCRVIRDDIVSIGVPICLTYFYAPRSDSYEHVPVLSKDDLIIPPQLVVVDSWNYGHFLTISSESLSNREILEGHCFWDEHFERYFDEKRNPLPDRIEPCGIYGFVMLNRVDFLIGHALGFFESINEYRSLPDLPELERPRRATDPIAIEILIPHEELDRVEMGIDQIEDAFEDLFDKKKLAEWVETGGSAQDRYLFYEVKPRNVKAFSEAVQSNFSRWGITNYVMRNSETAEELN